MAIGKLEGIADLPERVEPVYRWVYRPEMQFSVYEFARQQIKFTKLDETFQVIDLVNIPESELLSELLAEDLDFVELLFELGAPITNELAGFGPDRELILSIGGEEGIIQLGSSGSVRFDNPDHISQLTAGDYTLINLYQNNDSANVLWAYNYIPLDARVDNNRDGIVQIGQAELSDPDAISDVTSETFPFRFWVNNDYDVVNNDDDVDPEITECPPGTKGDEQVCEQWDEAVENSNDPNNTSDDNHFGRIETERDLEDFSPLLVQLPLNYGEEGFLDLPEGANISFKAHNISINLFRGVWEEGTDYLTDENKMKNQVKAMFDTDGDGDDDAMYLFKVGVGQEEYKLDQDKLDDYFGKERVGRFIFESYAASPESCIETPEDCYLEIALVKEDEILGSKKVYMQFHDVKHYYDHYSVGTDEAQDGDHPLFSSATNLHESDMSHTYINLYQNGENGAKQLDEEFKDEYIMMVHGWRMQFPERVSFAETAFKRLYWSGYRGRYGFYSWPTGWFDKPANEYNPLVLATVYLPGNEQNYGSSEVVARAAGAKLTNLLATLDSGKNVHIFAHSMGNVVVSEALRVANGSKIVDHYIASQAAEVGSSYSPLQPFIEHDIVISPNVECLISGNDRYPEEAWRCYNDDPLVNTEYDMPPNHYSYVVPELHGPTSPTLESKVASGPHYYEGIDVAAGGKIVNFYNERDLALEGWEFNQLTKPDNLGGPHWEYKWLWDCPYGAIACVANYPEFEDGDEVTDRYWSFIGGNSSGPGPIVPSITEEFIWQESNPINTESAKILAHIIPARTNALGQRATTKDGTEIAGPVNLEEVSDQFNNSNHGHSAQYYSNFLGRMDYWDNVLFEFELKDNEE